jgi:hypothetical protein
MSVLSILTEYEMTPHGHPQLGQGIDLGFLGPTAMHNYRMDRIPMVTWSCNPFVETPQQHLTGL